MAQVPPQKSAKKRIRVEDCVPAEYTSSPIVDILAKAEKEVNVCERMGMFKWKDLYMKICSDIKFHVKIKVFIYPP